MKKLRKVIIVHGTGGHSGENWFPWMKEKLEQKGHTVFVSDFPGADKPNLDDWKKEFKKYEESIDEETILIGHSLGGTFILKILEELSLKARSVFLIASPIGIKPIKYYDGDMKFVGNFDFNWDSIKETCNNFTVFHSDNDPYVCLENGKQLSQRVDGDFVFIPDSGHFNEEAGYTAFEKLLEKITIKK